MHQKIPRQINEFTQNSFNACEIMEIIGSIVSNDHDNSTLIALTSIIRQQMLSVDNLHKEEYNLRYIPLIETGDASDINLEKFGNLPADLLAHLIGAISCNYNGYIRQQAVNYLGKIQSRECLPYILVRLNDWVRQVREEAEKSFTGHYQNLDIKDIIANISIINWLKRSSKYTRYFQEAYIEDIIANHGIEITKKNSVFNILQKVKALIVTSLNDIHALEVIQNAPLLARRFCWQVIADQANNKLLEIALKDRAPEIRGIAAIKIDKKQIPAILTSEKSVKVKRAIISSLEESDVMENRQILEQGHNCPKF